MKKLLGHFGFFIFGKVKKWKKWKVRKRADGQEGAISLEVGSLSNVGQGCKAGLWNFKRISERKNLYTWLLKTKLPR